MSALRGLDQYLTPPDPDWATEAAERDETTSEYADMILGAYIADDPQGICDGILAAPGSKDFENALCVIRLKADSACRDAVTKRAQELEGV